MTRLFDRLEIRDITFANRVFVSPMCEYSSTDGFANDWHVVHLGSRAVGGAGLVLTDAIAVTPEGRISPQDLGIRNDAHGAAERVRRSARGPGAARWLRAVGPRSRGSASRSIPAIRYRRRSTRRG